MFRVLARRLAIVKQRGPPPAGGGAESKADKQAKRNLKKARRAQEVAAKKARKAGALGRVVATFSDVSKFLPDGRPLFTGFSAQVKARARIGIIGPNGSGKSSLLNVLANLDDDYTGEVSLPADINVGYLTQSPQLDPSHTVREAVESGLGRVLGLKTRFHELCDGVADLEPERRFAEHRIIDPEVQGVLAEIDEIGRTIARTGRDNWISDAKVNLAMAALRCPPSDRLVSSLSGGEARRVDLARVLLSKPDLLLLDEPTNHLDTLSVAWLEEFLRRYEGTVMCVTHDRYFLDRVANWTLEFDQGTRGAGNLVAFHGNYSRWLEAKDTERLAAARADDRRSRTMRAELDWLRAGAGRRSSRALHARRVENFEAMVAETRRERVDPGRIVIPPGPALAAQVVSFEDVRLETPDGRLLAEALTAEIPRGAIVGITGPNGAGKSTLLAALLGELQPKAGIIDVGESVRFGHVAQHSREALDDGQTVHQAMMQDLGSGSINAASDVIDLGGGRSIPVRAFLALFGFRGGTQDKAVSALSGGERNRLLLARTLASGSNVLLLDEPTNDLDVDTLRSLEDAMPDFPGCAIVVSHDRYFLDRTATHILHFDGAGGTEFFEGNWGQFEAHLRKRGLGDKFLSDEDVFRQVSFNSA